MAKHILTFPLRSRMFVAAVTRRLSSTRKTESKAGVTTNQGDLADTVRLYSRPEYGSVPYKKLQVPFDTFSIPSNGEYRANFLKFDLQSVDNDDIESSNNFEMTLKTDIQNMHPEVIYMEHVQETTFKVNIQKALRQIGYDGYYTKTYEDRGMATFFKTDLFRGSPLKS